MKTTKKLAYFCVAVLSDVFCLTSCTSEEVNPNYDAKRGVVKTEFTISIPAKPAGTRMTEATVQGQTTPVFRGIEGIKLYPFKSKKANISGSTDLPSAITLLGTGSDQIGVTSSGPSGVDDNKIDNSSAFFTTGNNAHLYKDVEIEIGTKAFMFYGVAIPSTGGSAANGELIHNLDAAIAATDHNPEISKADKLENVTFCHRKIYDGNLGTNATGIASYLTKIANVSGWSTSDQNSVILGTLYNKFISMKAGSWASVKGAVQQLYSSLHGRCYTYDSTSGSYVETSFASTAAGVLAKAIMVEILNDNVTDSNNDGILEFKANSYGSFPADINLPDGAIYMNWQKKENSTTEYEFKMMSSAEDNTGLNITDLNTYVYPVPLYYRALSDIITADVPKSSVYNTANSWSEVIVEYGTYETGVNDEVKHTTRSIALYDQVQYAVARLDVTVKAKTPSTNPGMLQDNRSKLPDYDTDEYIKLYTLTDPADASTKTFDKFPVTGILVGNQNSVDYQFHKLGTENYTIYDKVVPTDASGNYTLFLKDDAPTTAETIHTLVFETPVVPDTPTSEQQANGKVKIAVEFKNNSGEWFAGIGGKIIYPDSKFYLVGEFDPLAVTDPSDNPEGLRQVFKQDYTTTANLVINSLKNAYNTMPDLRAPQLELGLSVNLTWQTGIRQTITID